jgi:hypothetical protein
MHAGHRRGKRHLKGSMHDSPAVICLSSVLFVDVKRIPIAGKSGKRQDIFRGDVPLELGFQTGSQLAGRKYARILVR